MVDYVLVEPRDAVVEQLDGGEEGEGPGEACGEDDAVDSGDGGAVLEVDCSGGRVNVGDCGAAGDVRVVEGAVAEVEVCFAAVYDGVDGEFGCFDEVDGDVCA